jgi:FkbM family methyltransferase
MLGKLIKWSAGKAGLQLIPRWRLENLPLAQHLQSIFNRYRIDCVLDVGANVGQYRTFLRQEVGYGGNIVSYEPVIEHVEAMRAVPRDAGWRIEHCALGASNGTADINVMLDGRLNSMLTPGSQPTQVLTERNVVQRVDKVPMQTLDAAFARIEPRPNATYLKLDTQGFDLEVAKGGSETLTRVAALQCEASVVPIYQGMPSYKEAIEFFENRGFTLSGMFPVTLDADLRLVEFDCVMVRR